MENNEEMENLDSETQDNDGDDVTTEEVEETSSETESSDEYEKARKIAEDQKRRAEKAEEKLKELKAQLEDKKVEPTKSEGQKETKVSDSQLTKEEAILYARGLSEEEVEKAKAIAKIEGESPLVSAGSDYFKIWKDKEDKKKESQETQLGASRGSIKTQPKKGFTDKLSADEHKELWKKQMGY